MCSDRRAEVSLGPPQRPQRDVFYRPPAIALRELLRPKQAYRSLHVRATAACTSLLERVKPACSAA
jgi:hypothetical protein